MCCAELCCAVLCLHHTMSLALQTLPLFIRAPISTLYVSPVGGAHAGRPCGPRPPPAPVLHIGAAASSWFHCLGNGASCVGLWLAHGAAHAAPAHQGGWEGLRCAQPVHRLSNTVWLACVKPTLHLRSTVGRWIPDAVVRRCFPKVFVCFGPSPLYVTRFRSACVCAAFPCSHSCLAARRRACSAGHTTSRLCRWAGWASGESQQGSRAG